MLSNPLMHIFTGLNPIKTMVVDEASQITLGNYVSPLQNFPSIHKLCMIGDDKQCESIVIVAYARFLSDYQCLPMALRMKKT